MLHLKFALNLEHLADEMIKEISKKWTDPFNAPVVIFPDPKLEQWFKLRWLKKKGVLANLNKCTIDQFLLEILVGDNKQSKKLSSDMLAIVIMAYLLKENESGEPNYKSIDKKGTLAKYLETNGKQDLGRLYDLANKLAGLFLEYETSRPKQFLQNEYNTGANGILDYWSEDLLNTTGLKDFFVKEKADGKFEPVENESWERELYSKIFHNAKTKSLLTEVFENADRESGSTKKTQYLTLPFLYRDCLDSSNTPHFNYKSNAPVFIFGLSGMGQFYRVVLREFSKQYDVHAYIQNPCMKFWEDLDTSRLVPKVKTTHVEDKITETEDYIRDDENTLLRLWGKSGRDNIKLWCLTDDYSSCDFNEGERLSLLDKKQGKPDTLLHAVQYLVSNRENTFEEGPFKKEANDASITVTAAPSKLREIEALHSSICKLLLNGVKANEILVVSPNLQEYSPFIYQIFDQAKMAAENGDKSIIHIPYTILDSISKDSLTGSLIETLFQVHDTKSVSRPDFFNLVRNPVVQAARSITPNMVSVWETWVTDMNIYRDRPNEGFMPWLQGVKRMLLSRLTSATIERPEGTCTPYANMDSSNDAVLLKFINTIEDLEKWTSAFSDRLTPSDVETLFDMFNSWARTGNVSDDLVGEKAAYHEICKAINRLKYFFLANQESIPVDIVRRTLLQASSVSEYSFGNLFVNGITFMKFAPNRIIPVKHLFFIGADVDHFPKENSYNTLDLRTLVRPWPGDDSNTNRNRYAFLCQLMSTTEGFHISYQNMDLSKDSEIYPSPVINDLKNFIDGFAAPESLTTYNVPLDEIRSKDSLFTRRGRRYMESITLLWNPTQADTGDFANAGTTYTELKTPDKVTVSNLKKYLKDPFQFYVERLINISEIEDDPTEINVEPIALNKLDESTYLKEVVHINRGLNKIFANEETYFKSLYDQDRIPHGSFGAGITEAISQKAAKINAELDKFFPQDKYTFQPIQLNENYSIEQGDEFTLQGNIPLAFISNENARECVVVEISNSSNNGKDKFLAPYIEALSLIASKKMDKVGLFVAAGKCSKQEQFDKVFTELDIDSTSARKILCDIYDNAYVTCQKKVLPIDLLSKKLGSLEELKMELDNGDGRGCWEYFAGKDIFIDDLANVSGYSTTNFESEWDEARNKQIALLACLANKFFAENENGEQ